MWILKLILRSELQGVPHWCWAASPGAGRSWKEPDPTSPLMGFTHVTNVEGICFLRPVLIEIAHKPTHAWGLPVSYYYFFHFGGRLCFLGKQEKQRGKKALFVSLAWSSLLEPFPAVEMTVQAAPWHQRVPLVCEGLVGVTLPSPKHR